MNANLVLTPVAEIAQLHAELADMARSSLPKAIRIGELLTEIRAGMKHGAWLPWLADNVPFSQRTARNYVLCWARREDLKSASVADLASAYRLISDQPKRKRADSAPEDPPNFEDEVFSAWRALLRKFPIARAPEILKLVGSWCVDGGSA